MTPALKIKPYHHSGKNDVNKLIENEDRALRLAV